MDTFVDNKRPFAIEWPEPDMSLVRSRRSAPPPLPIELLGDKWGNWIVETAKARSAPVDYVFAGWSSSIAAMIGGARRASPWGDWNEPTIVNFGILGSPSSNKTPSLRPVLAMVKKVEAEMNLDYDGFGQEPSGEAFLTLESICLSELPNYSETPDALGAIADELPASKAAAFLRPQTGRAWLLTGPRKIAISLSTDGVCSVFSYDGDASKLMFDLEKNVRFIRLSNEKVGTQFQVMYSIFTPDYRGHGQQYALVSVTYSDSIPGAIVSVIPEALYKAQGFDPPKPF